ncbi:MAG: anaerobic ribonucleoside-triphosphate reductase activating protein [Opitutaceae bacterium]|jgi:pyruvate formate lyase activating enzyme|nr:anaerobic ribonucleoside-triphosphate reductase activating protein [Opitutaceae bacterium]
MRIGGYVPLSLSDYPGQLAAVVFTQGCNWRCPWCHNPALVHPALFTPPIPVETVLARLAARRGRLDALVITGGEPTLHDGLPGFIGRVRDLGYKIKLDTNGSRPAVLRALLERGLLDFVAVDLKAPWDRYPEAAGLPALDTAPLRETLRLLRETRTPHHLRTTLWPGLSDADKPALAEAAAGSPHHYQPFRPPA